MAKYRMNQSVTKQSRMSKRVVGRRRWRSSTMDSLGQESTRSYTDTEQEDDEEFDFDGGYNRHRTGVCVVMSVVITCMFDVFCKKYTYV